ncbi:MAG TPA: AAA family ATPase [Ktedonobacteraceae bacterium]|jgi:DNA repair exonuclease SbcCD ATPase subunit|nr:AAA family ATPase [Ktedonobacteraceae bacterium]
MIILKHLIVERFRLLREIDLHFPQRGSILIQGPNEAGKSTIFEAIYFALYGEPLAPPSQRGKQPGTDRSLDDLIHYGEPSALVTLDLSIGVTSLSITRTIERGMGQQVSLRVQRLGMPEEAPVTSLKAANERIIAELGRIDGETLRSSCLIEQKGLSLLEQMGGRERETVLRKLLGLEKLTRLSEQFKLTGQDEKLLDESRMRLTLAEVQARIPELSTRLGDIEAALDAVSITEHLAAIHQQELEIDEQQRALEQIEVRRREMRARQNRIQQLKKAGAVLAEIIASYDDIAEAQRALPELERQIAELELRRSEELPALEQRVRDLSELSRSFGTLERMAADLLAVVNSVKELEQELKDYEQLRADIEELDEKIIHARLRVEEAQQAQYEMEEQRRSAKPQLEQRRQRLRRLAQQLKALRQAEEEYRQIQARRGSPEEQVEQLKKVERELQESEQELALVQNEAQQLQQQADDIEKRWRKLSLHRQLEEWQRLKGLMKGLTEAEQHVMAAHQQQERLTMEALAQRRAATIQLGITVACVVLFLLCGGAALVEALNKSIIFATIAGLVALLLAAGAGYSYQIYSKIRKKEQEADRQMQEAINQVSMMVAARETAIRMSGGQGGSQEALEQVEHEIRSLGGSVPRSLEEAQQLLQQVSTPEESLADMQQQMNESRNKALAARNQVNVTMEAVAAARKERARLQALDNRESQEAIHEKLQAKQAAIQQIQSEIVVAAGKEGLALPVGETLNAPTEDGQEQVQPYESVVEDAIKSTEREIAVLDGKLASLPDLATQVKIYQDALDVLLAHRQAHLERLERYQDNPPTQQIAHAREQQLTLRDALRSLQDSLRKRVQPLGIAFGQAAINSAEAGARKQLELLHITLDGKIELENRHAFYTALLKERQESLSDGYRQLAKFSTTLGSWIVPPNPFAEALVALRNRCQREMQQEGEENILRELEELRLQEGASRVKIELCREEIETAQERVATTLAQRNRPPAKGFTLVDIAAVWPLVGQYSPEQRAPLEEEQAGVDQELRRLEQQELDLSTQLHTGGEKLDLELARKHVEQQERNYQTKKRAGLLIDATCERIMRKMVPRTEYFMQQLLPLLTRGRYHDVRLTTEPEEGTASGGPFQLRIWEASAGAYIVKSALSSGTADQISLALRLAFAIAALPRELGAAPGFLLLDEPVGSFSRDRMQALAQIITGDMLGSHFEQILFISHDSAFESTSFPYHVSIEDGTIVESNLSMKAGDVQRTSPQERDQSGLYTPARLTWPSEPDAHSNGTTPLTASQPL